MPCGSKWFFTPAWCPLRQYLVSSELLINFFYTSSLLMAPLGNGFLKKFCFWFFSFALILWRDFFVDFPNRKWTVFSSFFITLYFDKFFETKRLNWRLEKISSILTVCIGWRGIETALCLMNKVLISKNIVLLWTKYLWI